jgi:hypothetical protein
MVYITVLVRSTGSAYVNGPLDITLACILMSERNMVITMTQLRKYPSHTSDRGSHIRNPQKQVRPQIASQALYPRGRAVTPNIRCGCRTVRSLEVPVPSQPRLNAVSPRLKSVQLDSLGTRVTYEMTKAMEEEEPIKGLRRWVRKRFVGCLNTVIQLKQG